MVRQLELLPNMLNSIGIKCISYQGYEGDEILGTMAKRALEDGFKVFILPGDTDMVQLVND